LGLQGCRMSALRKIKRKKQKEFMKHFKKSMKKFKKQVKCSKCDYHPQPGENIDDWHIDKYSDSVDLICTSCYTSNEVLDLEEEEGEDYGKI